MKHLLKMEKRRKENEKVMLNILKEETEEDDENEKRLVKLNKSIKAES